MNAADKFLKAMHNATGTEKGTPGELAVMEICKQFYNQQPAILIHSFEYEVDPREEGNLKRGDNGNYYIENLGSHTELDVLLVTQYNVYPIEVKSYKSNKITLTDGGISGCKVTNKSPVHQNEMHCRHLYSRIFEALPNGSTEYIVPIVCFVDKTQIVDMRSDWQKDYIKVCGLNQLGSLIRKYDVPRDYLLDVPKIERILKSMSLKHSIWLKCKES